MKGWQKSKVLQTLAEQDAARSNRKSLKADQVIINQDETDLAKLEALEAISKQAKSAAKAMVSAGPISKQNQK
jgi:hypothetical protein